MSESRLGRIRERLRAILKSLKFEYTSPRFDTSDVLQESIIQVAKEIEAEEKPDSKISYSWLKSVVTGHLANLLRFNNAAKRSIKRESADAEQATSGSSEYDPILKSAEKEETTIVLESLAELSPQRRRIINMRFYHQLTYDQIAETLDITVYAVRTELAASLKQIRTRIDSTDAS